jgi:tRNA (adenine22-N1)-methyltransferase
MEVSMLKEIKNNCIVVIRLNEQVLSERLKKVVNYIPKGARIADIGSDHAYLPCYAYLQGVISTAIAGEVNEGPLNSAKKQVKKLQLDEVISVRKGNGLDVVEQGEVDAITIAGMGGPLITSILEAGKDKLDKVQRLILQPNIAAIVIREWLLKNKWQLIAEEIVEEDGKIYEILVAKPGNEDVLYRDNKEAKLLLGPYLMKEKHAAFIKKWTHELNKWEKIVKQLTQAQNEKELKEKQQEMEKQISLVKEVLSNETS